MTSRLDRLFVLLECGTSGVTRRAAARQLGEVQRAHPHELHRLLARLTTYLRSSAWETRVAASQAVEAILANVPAWDPSPYTIKKEEKEEPSSGQLRCGTFDMERVLKHGAHLMGSEGNEYDLEEGLASGPDLKEKLARQRQQLNSRLGLDVACKLGMDLSDVYTNEDLMCSVKSSVQPKCEAVRRPVSELVASASLAHLSSREQNRARRKARQAMFSKQKSRDASNDEGSSSAPLTPLTPTPEEPDKKKIKLEKVSDDVFFTDECVPQYDGTWGATCTRWPLESWACAVSAGLFSASWEARHGAASALRELLRAPVVVGAGKEAYSTQEQMEEGHQNWLEDMSLRLLCVLALDRFGDFVSDQVVAPVRETCAQALGVAFSRLSSERVCSVAALLAQLLGQAQWEARHGALLGFKYLVAAREELACSTNAFEHLIAGLSDPVDDVGAVAAGALTPAAAAFLRARPDALRPVVSRLWELLRDQDDLAAACNSYMALLAALISQPQAAKLLHPIPLSDVLPRLWPYLDHSTSSVRKATLQTLRTLTRPLNRTSEQSNGENANRNDEITSNDVPSSTSDAPFLNDVQSSESNGNSVEYMQWNPELLQEAMRYIYQRVLFEHLNEIQEIAEQVWQNLLSYSRLETLLLAACPVLSTWLCLAMRPARMPVEPPLLLQPPQLKERRARPLSQSEGGIIPPAPAEVERPAQKWYLGGSESTQQTLRDKNVMRARCVASRMLGLLSCYIVLPAPGIEYKPEDESPVDCYVKVLVVYLNSGSALQRLVVGLVICAWAQNSFHRNPALINNPAPMPSTNGDAPNPTMSTNGELTIGEATNGDSCTSDGSANENGPLAPSLLTDTLHRVLDQNIYYDEVAQSCTRILQEVRDLIAMMRHYQLPVGTDQFSNILRLEQVTQTTSLMQPMIANMKLKRVAPSLEERRKNLQTAAAQTLLDHNNYNVQVQAAMAGACACLRSLPERLNPVVKPLMESIKKEPHEELQMITAQTLATLLEQCASRQPSPNAKVLINLKAFLRCDSEFTPRVALDSSEDPSNADSGSNESGAESGKQNPHGPQLDRWTGILTLWEQQRVAERSTQRRGATGTLRPGPGRPPAIDMSLEHMLAQEDDTQKQLRIQRRGATLALTTLTRHFADDLPHKLPKLWEFITEPFALILTPNELESQSVPDAEELISCLQVLETVCGSVSAGLRARVETGAACVARLTRHDFTAVRHMAARCLAALATLRPANLMQLYIEEVVPALGAVGNERVRCGAAEALARLVDALKLQVVPYIVLLVVPLLGRMSDHCEPVRLMSTRCFASLIQLMPLDGAVPEPEGLSDELRERKHRDKHFLEQLFNPKSIKDYKIPIPVSAELRSYQQAGVNWLRFLNEYKLHGVLCDDMGLGKTLQSIVVVAGDHWDRCQRYASTRAPDLAPLPSLVVCPPTLTGHWYYEVKKFIPKKYLNPLQYIGPPFERDKLRVLYKHYNLIIASYDIVRKDIDFFSSIKWNYCILDEGHIIKNGKTKAFKAIKMLVANHRLILSGTPIQNNVLELWSLFDFLMPGLLGTERQFMARYSRPILQARDPRATPHHQQAGALACEALHRQVLPFLLRRVKEDVLKELPPKITQDYYCELSPLQRRLYEDFSKTHMPDGISIRDSSHGHIFQALRYLQNVCNHPKLVLTDEHPEYAQIQQELTAEHSSLSEIQHSAKLPALLQLLQDCGIGVTQTDSAVLSQHRALIFCQLKGMLDIVERDLLKAHMPGVSYLRLDGSVPPGARHGVVQRFNNDPSIDVLLLTTRVGGLGLNLTGADTVIFVEHDWNPMKDLQAMDRAHRIGQKKVVNVYRLITRNTLEEKIMGLQKFKLLTANTIISNENASIETMGTDQLLDLFHLSSEPKSATGARAGSGTQAGSATQTGPGQPGPSGALTSVVEALPDLWDDKQYEEEYDMSHFIQGLKKTKT